ncbi:hypothetical protein [Thermoflexibacter ruber]|uniref:Uncharacterized protein n=1 Tax=Thermoflexibacter ruber TaxID=1003 RepID=A0A1I2IED1_9BACT|nr:hypothetical protein [Thermoflexibacter ruber]SFF39990.1 hypothetical protein SAMN04488541_10318 [Thermoflexibacter ruber]
MGYSNYKSLRQALDKLNLEEIDLDLFPKVMPIEPSDWLKKSLEIAALLPLTNEKSKSEKLISPILSEVVIQYLDSITLYSGEELYVDESQDLAGACDFFIAKHPKKKVMQAPIVTVVEAKDEDFDYGQGQCIAQMYAAQLFNEQKGKPQAFIYGCASTGGEWQFLKLAGKQVLIDNKTYYLPDLPVILGIFHQIVRSFL